MTLLLADLLVRSSKGAKDIARALDGAEVSLVMMGTCSGDN